MGGKDENQASGERTCLNKLAFSKLRVYLYNPHATTQADKEFNAAFARRFDRGSHRYINERMSSMLHLLNSSFKSIERKVRSWRRPPSKKSVWTFLAQNNYKGLLVDTPHGKFWVRPGDSAIGYALFTNGEFDFIDFSRLKNAISNGTINLPKDAIFLDVGANIGTHTIYALNSGLFSQAISFEPDPGNFQLLEMNIKANGLGDKCHLLNIALGADAGTAELELAEDNFGDHRIRRDESATSTDARYAEGNRETTSVRMETLDQTLSDLGVDPSRCFLHMDVQGFEPYVLQGAQNFLASCETIFTEFWPYGLSRSGGTDDFRALAEKHFSYFIDFGAGETHTRPINTLKDLFDRYAEGIGTTLLLTKAPSAP